jgi:hypothetical protein
LLEVFRELEVTGDTSVLDDFIDRVSRALPDGWSRNRAREKDAKLVGGHRLFAFHCKDVGRWPAADLFLARDYGRFKVTNIVPEKAGSLSRSQYNAVLNEFAEQAIRPAASALGLEVSVTDEHAPITRWLSAEATLLLRQFSENANKGTGSSHPLDFSRWAAFLIQAHRDGSELDAQTLLRWLVEEEDWPEDTADRLAIEYEFSHELLQQYDNAKR